MIIRNVFWASTQHIRSISWHWSKFSLAISGINNILTYIQIEYHYIKFYIFITVLLDITLLLTKLYEVSHRVVRAGLHVSLSLGFHCKFSVQYLLHWHFFIKAAARLHLIITPFPTPLPLILHRCTHGTFLLLQTLIHKQRIPQIPLFHLSHSPSLFMPMARHFW